jgi:hypothetical protein
LIFTEINFKKDFKFSFLKKIKDELYIENELFYFLNLNSNCDSNYIGFVDNNKFQFKLDNQILDFSFNINK